MQVTFHIPSVYSLLFSFRNPEIREKNAWKRIL